MEVKRVIDPKYGIPELKKYPMPDRRHVLSAIKFFNYVSPKYEKQLAGAILARIKEYGMSFDDFGVGKDNRFSKYIPKNDYLEHHGILGQRWGKRNGPPYPLTESKHSAREKKEADRAVKIAKGKAAAKKVLIVAGAAAITALVVKAAMSSGSNKWVAISQKHGSLKAKDKKPSRRTGGYGSIESQIATSIHGRESNGMRLIDQPLFQWPSGKYIYQVRNNFDGTYTVLSKKRTPNTPDGLFERDND